MDGGTGASSRPGAWRSRARGAATGDAQPASPKDRLHACIDRLTRSGRASLEPADASELKRLCRSDQQLVELAHSLLCHRLAQEHAQIRQSAFQIVDLLFRRSRRFRELVLDRFERLVAAVLIENEAACPPPKPVSVFRQLGDLALQAFIEWNEKFSSEHPKLVFAFRFLSQAHAARLAQVRSRLAQASEQRQAEARRLAAKKRDLFQDARQQFSDEEAELDACLATVSNCLELLVPRPEDFDVNALTSGRLVDFDAVGGLVDDDDDFGEAATEEERRRLHGIVSSTTTATAGAAGQVILRLARPCLRETPDNAELIEALVTRAEQLRKRLRPRLARWLALVERCSDGGSLGGGVEEAEAAELRSRLTELIGRSDRLLSQVQRLKIVRSGEGSASANADDLMTDDEDADGVESTTSDDFEAVEKKDGFELDAAAPSTSAAAAAATAVASKRPAPQSSAKSKPSTSAAAAAAADPSSTSAAAPVLPFGPDLLHWGADDANAAGAATIGYRMDDGGHSFGYRPLDGDESFEISGSRHILTMRTMVFASRDEPVKWTCRHPLPDGGLCGRMDRLKCPFHGRIVPRDADGKPAATTTTTTTTTVEGSNPAPADKEASKKKKSKKKPQAEAEPAAASAGLVNIRKLVDTPRSRLAARVASKAALRRAAEDEAARRRRKMQEKFGDQFQYQFLN